ncbi:MAG: bifunctional sugar-1-phosphate nucleotidylyltransferase/acetyltransferase [Candidatus Thorarchaeota archaeon]
MSMKVLILAAGYGTRLHPLTQNRPKAMLPLFGKPMLHHVIDSVVEAGMKEIVLVVGHYRDQIESYFGNGNQFGVTINYAEQSEPKGEYDAVLAAEEQLAGENRFLMTDCDIITTANRFKEVLRAAKAGDMALSLYEVPNPWQFGVVELDGTKIKTIVEKPKKGTEPSNLAVAGVYVFSDAIFDTLRKTQDLEVGIQSLINEGHTVYGSHLRDPWVDVGRTWNILEALPILFERLRHQQGDRIDSSATVSDSVHIIGDVWVGPNARIYPGASLVGPVFIGSKAVIGNNCLIRDHTVIEQGTRTGFSCELRNTLMMPGSKIGHLAFIGDSILGFDVEVGASVVLSNYRFDGAEVRVMLREQLVSTHTDKFGAVIGDTAKIGCGVVVLPGRTIGYNSWIDPSIVVEKDVGDNIHLKLKQSLTEEQRRQSI